MHIIRCFHAASGLKVSFHKCKVYGIGVLEKGISNCARVLGCETTLLPFKFLGVAVGVNMTRKRNWQPVFDRVQSKLSSWKPKLFRLEEGSSLPNQFWASYRFIISLFFGS